MAELRAIGLGKRGQTAGVEPFEVFVERIDEYPERQLSLELRRAPRQHEVPSLLGARGQLGEQACLAHPRLAYERERGRVIPLDLGEREVQRAQLPGAPDERLTEIGHGWPSSCGA